MYDFNVIVSGVPGKSRSHGAFGWSSVSLLRAGSANVLVETGPPAYIPLLHQRLAALGVGAEDITHVLITHLHWDHVSNFTMFPRAEMIIGRAEMDWASQLPPGTIFMPDLHIKEFARRPESTRFVADGEEVLPGITAFSVPGHTPGHLAFEVAGAQHRTIFAGDAVKNRFELASGDVDSTMDRAASRSSVSLIKQKLEQDPEAVLVPGHDVPLRLVDGQVVPMAEHDVEVEVYADAVSGAVVRHLL